MRHIVFMIDILYLRLLKICYYYLSHLFVIFFFFFFSSRRRHTRCSRDWSSDVCSSDLFAGLRETATTADARQGRGSHEQLDSRPVAPIAKRRKRGRRGRGGTPF